ncbi:MAG: hypothetical protein C5B47_00135 [Verrucomicrobia bacterium]|nr:MAG: hypothetical protein C5B47_00135 [Verrucomicrobiota bacterium]
MAGINARQATCPHCGHTQAEPSQFISTFCRGCSRYYSVRNAKTVSLVPIQSKRTILNRNLVCYRCGQHQRVSAYAKTTLCVQCNTAISLTNVSITHSTSQEIDTRGQLTISPTGYLAGGLSVCGSAAIKGKLSGILLCEQTIRLSGKGRYRAQLIAKCVLIERDADLYFHFPICTEELIVYGQLASAILCRGPIRIRKKGFLEGPAWARAIDVAKNGRYVGNLQIHQDEPKESPRISFREFPELSTNKHRRRIVPGESPI